MGKHEEIFAFMILIIFRIAGCFVVWYIKPGDYKLLGGVIVLLVLLTFFDWHQNQWAKKEYKTKG